MSKIAIFFDTFEGYVDWIDIFMLNSAEKPQSVGNQENALANLSKNMHNNRHVYLQIRSRMFNSLQPYNDLPDLPPPIELETKAILKKCIRASSALAELRGVGDLIPNQNLLIRAVGLQEARVSSAIENIVTTTDDLYKALADSIDKVDPTTKEVLRYQEAITFGFREITRQPLLTTNLLCKIVSIIKQQEMDVRKLPGTKIVKNQVEVIYTPPEGSDVIRKKLQSLERFIHEEKELDPLIRMALIHYQFEAIHPFTDGNGRTGRILNILFLVQNQLLKVPVLYLSKYLIEHKSEYLSGLRSVTEDGAWEPWVLFMLDAIEHMAKQTSDKILAIRQLMQTTGDVIKEKLHNIYSKDLVELLFYNPYSKVRFLEEQNIAKRQTASTYLKALEDIGLLASVKIGRENYYINTGLIELLRQ